VEAAEALEEEADSVAGASTVAAVDLAVAAVLEEEPPDPAGDLEGAALEAEASREAGSIPEVAARILGISAEVDSPIAAAASAILGKADLGEAEPDFAPISSTCQARVAADSRLVRVRRSTRAAASHAISTSATAPAVDSVRISRDRPRASD
jgi:hypothetical protein